MLIFILFFIFILLTIVSYYIFDKDIIAPPVIFCAMYTLSIGMSLTQYKNWDLEDYSVEAFNIYLFGGILFILIGFLIKKTLCFTSNTDEVIIESPSIPKFIHMNELVFICSLIIDFITLVLLIKFVKEITGGGNFSQMMESFRAQTSYSTSVQVPGYIDQLSKLVTINAYISGFIFINNLFVRKPTIKDYTLLLSIVIYFILSIYSSNRLNLLEIIAALVVYYCFIQSFVYKQKNSVSLIFKLLIVLILVLVAFYLIRLLVGRNGSSNTGMTDYLSMYIGGPVKLFDMFLKEPVKSDFLGKDTFYGFLRNLRSLGLCDVPNYVAHKEFRSINGIGLGNVYSAYRGWFSDFGISGVFVLQTIFALIFNFLYYRIKQSNYYKHPLEIIIYGYVVAPVFMHPIDDQFFRYLSIGYILYLIEFYIVYKLMTVKFIFSEK